ncbi:AAA family ATPase, partial [Aeromonas media]
MKSIRIKNLRCFEDTGYIDIKPINLLVGLNSTGKSSFAR